PSSPVPLLRHRRPVRSRIGILHLDTTSPQRCPREGRHRRTVHAVRVRLPSPRLWMKLGAIALCFTVPLVVTAYFLLESKNEKIDFAKQELLGDRYLRPLSHLLVHLDLHATIVRAGD